MYKNQLQELAQRSCFNLPSYACIREGPDHAPRFKATVNFNGETFESPGFCTTLRQAEHSAAEVALTELAKRGPSRSLAAKVLDVVGVYKNLLQETVHRAGFKLPVYTTTRSGPGHLPVFDSSVELGEMVFSGEPAKNKKQAEKNAAMAAWTELKKMALSHSSSSSPSSAPERNNEQEQVIITRFLQSNRPPSDTRKSSAQTDRHRDNRRSAPYRPAVKPRNTGIALYPMQYPSWSYSNYSPEVAMYQIWEREQASRQQNCMFTLPLTPSPVVPQILPFIHSIYPSEHGQYILPTEPEPLNMVPITMPTSGSSLHLRSTMPVQIMSRSHVALQEMQEDVMQGKENLHHGDSDSNDCSSIQHDSTMLLPFGIGNSPIPGETHAVIQAPCEDLQKNNLSEFGVDQQGRSEQFAWSSQGSMDIGMRPIFGGLGCVELHSPRGIDTSVRLPSPAGELKCSTLPLSSAPVKIRTAAPVSTAHSRMPAPRPKIPTSSGRPRSLNVGGMPFTAPAVQIRSVVPVCSAPPARKMLETKIQEGCFGTERTREPENLSVATSELGKLHI